MRADYTDAQFEPETLISTHMDLVKRIAWHLHGRVHSAIEIDDLLQIGYVGLITAAQKYSKQEGVAFASYASLRIRGAMVDHLRKSSICAAQQFRCANASRRVRKNSPAS